MNSQLPLDTLGKTIVAHIEKGDKAAQHYKAAGIHLAEAKVRVKKDKLLTWGKFLRVHCDNLSVRRANEYIAIGDGRVKVSDMRKRVTKSTRKWRDAETKGKSRPNERHVTPKRSELPNEIKGTYASAELTPSETAAVIAVAVYAICNAEGRPDWKQIGRCLSEDLITKAMIEEVEAALKEIVEYV